MDQAYVFDPDEFISKGTELSNLKKEEESPTKDFSEEYTFNPDEFISKGTELNEEFKLEKGQSIANDARKYGNVISAGLSSVEGVGDLVLSPIVIASSEFGASISEGKDFKESTKRALGAGTADLAMGLAFIGAVKGVSQIAKGAKISERGANALKGMKGGITHDLVNEASNLALNRSADDLIELASVRNKFNVNIFKKETAEEVTKVAKQAKELVDESVKPYKNQLAQKRRLLKKKITPEMQRNAKTKVKELIKSGNLESPEINKLNKIISTPSNKQLKAEIKHLKQLRKKQLSPLRKLSREALVGVDKIENLKQLKQGDFSILKTIGFASISPMSATKDIIVSRVIQSDKVQKAVINALVEAYQSKMIKPTIKGVARVSSSIARKDLIRDALDNLSKEEIESISIKTINDILFDKENEKKKLLKRRK